MSIISDSMPTTDDGDDSRPWSGEELEAAYLRALDALEAVESEVVAIADEVAPGRLDEWPTEDLPQSSTPGPTGTWPEDAAAVSVEQVVEAFLFVGGASLTAARLASLLRSERTARDVELVIEQLNQQYAREQRPFEIRLEQGGYRLALRDDFEPIRHKVYGLGPREVKLSQDALEILALVAYFQPATEAKLAELGRPNSGATLRLLLRRDLLRVEREPGAKTVQYSTTERFLSLFGLSSIDDLPRPEDVTFK